MHNVRLIYVSKMTEACDTEALQDILSTSQENNEERGISGVLCYDPTFFMQVLEGPRDAINETYSRIAADTRHKDLTLLEYVEVEERLFGDWTMTFIRPDILDPETRKKFSVRDHINPFVLSADQAREFLLALVEAHRRLA